MKIYLDTSVYGGYYDEEFSNITRILFGCIYDNGLKILTSDVVEKELVNAPLQVRKLFLSTKNTKRLIINQEVKELAQMYIEGGALTNKCLADARHIAIATISNASAIVSWNFKHLVNFERIREYNVINLREGYKTINIEEPKKIIASYGYY